MPVRERVTVTAGPASARQAGLCWVCDRQTGLRREGEPPGFRYVDARGRVVRDPDVLARIRALAIPPAWREVWICPRPDGHLQATGRDARGRKQYRYHADWQARRGQTKFDGLRRFGQVLPRLRLRVARTLAAAEHSGLPTRELVLAAVVRLLDTTWLRIGNAAYAQSNGSYGLSTLKNRHAGVRGDEVQLRFVGKAGVQHAVRLTDRRVARVVRRCRDLPGQALFEYVEADGRIARIDSTDVNAWLADAGGEHVTAKDFRTWHASVLALEHTLAACTPPAEACTVPQIVAAVARRLGNTPAVCRKSYIHPRVLALGDALADTAAREALARQRALHEPPAARGLSRAERQLLALLRARAPAPSQPATSCSTASQSSTKRSMPKRSRAVR